MKISQLIGPEVVLVAGSGDTAISGLAADSRAVTPGAIFAALPGSAIDGRRFIPDAIAKGAAAILVPTGTEVSAPANVAVLHAHEPRLALAKIAARLYPRQPAHIVAVTGTSGKTSVADFTRQILTALGHNAASLGTIGIVKASGAVYGSLTTPDPVTLHKTLDALAAEGVTHLAMEASSHGLDQYRLDGVRLTAAAFTNLSRDHLDYHATMDDYLAAKLRLFTSVLPAGGNAVVFVDDGYDLEHNGPAQKAVAAAKSAGHSVLTVGLECGDLNSHLTMNAYPQQLEITFQGQRYQTELPLVGAYQRYNALVAAGLVIATGAAPSAVFAAFKQLQGVPGRLELIGHANSAPVLVDYAHKPDALESVLAELRNATSETGGRLVCVFGCGGDRDRGKRPIMGEIAARRADIVIVTDDNPRNETPVTIRAEILAGIPATQINKVREIGDRAEAINTAVGLLRTGDVLLVAGKGHETGQIIGSTTIPFSDSDTVRAALRALSSL
ncbi:MAG: UDP-N-acetylmuramoyl-L-alanyl-D-glutamate--2,6-diaminopimelate ligase [Hyphomicrobiaceae bacterium]|nr:UDP-N-acetylmuramoyl-L-alanyl-D-glutamate--2,6-diaminopimelate ligase [Hyphomicrobiaceae bacterium]